MKKLKLFSLLGLGILSTFGLLLGAMHNSGGSALYAEPDQAEPADPVDDPVDEPTADPVDETFECQVILGSVKHGTLKADKLEGHVGDLVTLNANADLFYMVKTITVNGTALVEDEETSEKFVFALVEGENKVAVTFVIDQELFGELSGMVEQISNGDWTSLFSLKNLIVIVSVLLNGGLLITIVRYYIKDKKLAKKVEDKVESTVERILPKTTREIIVKTLQELIAPYFAKIEAENGEMQEAMVVLCRCFALAQEDTPESKIAITKELSSLKLSDKASITQVEERIQAFIKENGDKMLEVLKKLDEMKANNQEIIEKAAEKEETAEVEQPKDFDNGTQIE